MEKQTIRRREWVKTFAIIFLSVLLVLTFFSQTIMNRSLPEIAGKYVESGSINARIRGTASISANETYDVTLSQTRKVRSILVQVGDAVSAGDVLLTLEAMESDELKLAQETLADMELNYQKNLIERSNSNSTEDREIQKLRDAYDEALATYRLYSSIDPSELTRASESAKLLLSDLQREVEDLQDRLTEMTTGSAYAEAKQAVIDAQSEISALTTEITAQEALLDTELPTSINEIDSLTSSIKEELTVSTQDLEVRRETLEQHQVAQITINGNSVSNEALRLEFLEFAGKYTDLCSSNVSVLMDFMQQVIETEEIVTKEYAVALQNAYKLLTQDEAAIANLQAHIDTLNNEVSALDLQRNCLVRLNQLKNEASGAEWELLRWNDEVSDWSNRISRLEVSVKNAQRAVEDQQLVVDRYASASSAVDALNAAEEALEDRVFTSSLGDSSSLDLKDAKEAIEAQKKLVEELSANADGQEIKANVSGVVSTIHVSAGNTIGAEMPAVTITVADRGYMVRIPVNAEQARQVRIGDTADISNYYSNDLTATLENIVNDPQSMGGKVLVFRLSGEDVEPDSNITLSIGQKSANYDALIPNSAIRNDSNGNFVLVVVAKSSPLGNRYVATRADVTVLASDDTSSAVSGLSNGDFVITTSTKPIEAGDQVRLEENG